MVATPRKRTCCRACSRGGRDTDNDSPANGLGIKLEAEFDRNCAGAMIFAS